jgi:predicted Zn-dependent protease
MFGTTHTGMPPKKKRNVRCARHRGLLNHAPAFHYSFRMKSSRRPDPDDRTVPPFGGRIQRLNTRISGFHLRDYWWRLLDFFEASRARRVALFAAAFFIIAGLAAWTWAYPWWERRNAIRIAQQWLDAGQLRNAAEAAQRAAALAPERPEPWQIASELARLGHQYDQALTYAHRAADLAPEDFPLAVTLATAALNAGKPVEAAAVLARLPVEKVNASPEALRLHGELARRDLRLTEARDSFEAALKLEPGSAINEVPLGLILLHSTITTERQHGLDLLGHWTADRQWGPVALRTLLQDSVERNDRDGMLRWGEALRTHPAVTVGDMPTWLLAFAKADESRYATALADLEKSHAVTPDAAAQLLGWLNKIGRSEDAVAWIKTLPAPAMRRPPLAVIAAEAYRATGRWAELLAATESGDWGAEANFLRWSYALTAAKKLQDSARADEQWRTLYNPGQLNTGHALFAASTLYSWGLSTEAEALWWRAGEQEGVNAIEALGSLARFYQVKGDADGLYRAFRRLHLLQPQNQDIANNFAFYALLLGREQRLADQIAKSNFEQRPENLNYQATLAFVSVQQGRFAEALTQLRPKASLAASSPGLGFVYGLALAGAGQKNEARVILNALPPETLTTTEAELIKQTLAKP